jgi:hypothetical protein
MCVAFGPSCVLVHVRRAFGWDDDAAADYDNDDAVVVVSCI